MCLRAAMRRPLRSKRLMISPVRLRANASGLTRMRVRSTGAPSSRGGWLARRRIPRDGPGDGRSAPAPDPRDPSSAGGRLDGRGLLGLAPAAAPRLGRLARDLRLAVGADLPLGVQRSPADAAGILELAQAGRAAQERLLDLVLAVRAEDVLE